MHTIAAHTLSGYKERKIEIEIAIRSIHIYRDIAESIYVQYIPALSTVTVV